MMKRMYKIICSFDADKFLYSNRIYESARAAYDDLEKALLICDDAWIQEICIESEAE